MQINWFTFSAQIVNFLALVWILKRLLYEPVVGAMQKREASIAARLQAAEDDQARADELQSEYNRRLEKLAHERDELMAVAAAEVQEWKQQQLQTARKEVETARSNWFRMLNREREAFIGEVQRNAGEHVMRATQVVLEQLSGRDLESAVVARFLDRLSKLDDAESAAVRSALTDSKHGAEIRSGSELSADLQTQVSDVVCRMLSREVRIHYVVDPDLICGIELHAGSHIVSWSVRESLETLDERFGRLLDASLSSVTHMTEMRGSPLSELSSQQSLVDHGKPDTGTESETGGSAADSGEMT